MRKKIIVGLSVLILVFNCVVERPKANAAALGAVAAAGGLGEGALTALGAAAGPYVIAGLILAAGGAAVYESVQHRQEIGRKAQQIWSGMSTTAKDAFNASLDASLKAGKESVTVSSDFLSYLKDNASELAKFVKSELWSTEAIDDQVMAANGIFLRASNADNTLPHGVLSIVDNSGRIATKFDILVNGDRAYQLTLADYSHDKKLELSYLPIINYDGLNDRRVIGELVDVNTGFYYLNKNLDFTTVSGLMSILAMAGYPIQVVPNLANTAIDASAVSQNVDNALQSVREIDLPLDNWLSQAKTADGAKINIGDIAAGGTYTGSIDYGVPDVPVIKVPDYVSPADPTMPIDQVFTGSDAAAGTGAGAGTGADTGALTDVVTGIRDFVGDIAKGIGTITGTLAHPVGDISKIEWDKLKVSAEGITTAFPFSLPWDIKRAISNITVDGQKPKFKFEIKIAGHLYSADVSIPSMFDPFVPIIRGFFVLIFIIGLIWATRSLFGGAI